MRDKLLYFVGFPAGHGAVDSPFGAMWLMGPAIAIGLDLSSSQIGLMFTIMIFAGGITHIPAGLIGETRWRGVFLASTFLLVASSFLIASFMQDYRKFFIFVAFGAAGAAAWHPVAMGTLAEKMPTRKGFVLGLHFLGGGVAEVIAPIGAGFLLGFMAWHHILQIAVIPSIVLGLVFLIVYRYIVPPVYGSLTLESVRETFRLASRFTSLKSLVVLGLYSMAIMALWSMVPFYLIKDRDMSSATAGFLFSMMVLMGAFGGPILGRFSDTRYQKAVVVASLILAIISILLIVITPFLPIVVVGLLGIGLLLMGIRPALISMVLGIVGGRQTQLLGIIMAGSEIVGAFGTLLAGMLGEIDLSFSILLAAGLTALAVLMLVITRPSRISLYDDFR